VQHLWLGTLVFIVSLAILGSFVPRSYSGDDLQYASVIRTAVTGEQLYHPVGSTPFPAPPGKPHVSVNPRYALDWPASVAAVRVARALGWTGDEIDVIVSTRVLMGALGVAFFFLTVLIISGRPWVAALSAFCLGSSTVYWTYSTHADESMSMVAFTSVALYLLVRQLMDPRARRRLGVPLFLGIASLFNLTAVATAVPAALIWSLDMTASRVRLRARALGQFALVFAATLLLGVLAALLATGAASSIASLAYWKGSFFVGRPQYGFHPVGDTFDLGADFVRALVSYPPVGGHPLRAYFTSASTAGRLGAVLFYGMVALLAVAPVLILLKHRPTTIGLRRVTMFASGWFLTSVIFAWWWDPTYVKYFLLPVMSWCLLLAISLTQIAASGPRLAYWGLGVATTAAVAMFALNLSTIFLPQSRGRQDSLAAARVLQRSPASALFVAVGQQPLDFYITYFARRDVVSTGLVRYANGTDAAVARVVGQHVRQHLRAHGPIYVYGRQALGPVESRSVLELLHRGSLKVAWRLPQTTVYRVTGAP